MKPNEDACHDDDPYSDVEVIMLDAAGVREMADNALDQAGCTWAESQTQAREGRFASHIAHEAWIVVSTFLESSSEPQTPKAGTVDGRLATVDVTPP